MKKTLRIAAASGLVVMATTSMLAQPAHAAVPTNDSLPTVSISGTAITVTHSTWSEAGFSVVRETDGSYATNQSPRQFHDYVVACDSVLTEVLTPITTNPLPGDCNAIYNANTGGIPASDTGAAYFGSSGSRTLMNLTGKYIGIISTYGGASTTIYRVLTLANGAYSSSGQNASESTPPSPKIPTINQMASGSLLVTPGTNAFLTGSRLNCTTYVKVNDVATTFTYSNLSDGSGQLIIAVPSSLKTGKHALTMDSCGGEVTYLNILTVAKAPVELRLDLANGTDRALGLIQLRAFMKEHRADYNTVTCTADSANSSQQKIANQVVSRYCQEAFSRLAMPVNRTTSVKSDHQGRSLILTISLSNR
jgi:hypothetical protein